MPSNAIGRKVRVINRGAYDYGQVGVVVAEMATYYRVNMGINIGVVGKFKTNVEFVHRSMPISPIFLREVDDVTV